jgi:hypothetical protein
VHHGGVGAIELDHGPGERAVEGLVGERLGDPTPGGDDTGVADLDDLGEVLGGDGVVLLGRHDHPTVGAADAHDEALAEAGHERSDTGPVVRRNGYSMVTGALSTSSPSMDASLRLQQDRRAVAAHRRRTVTRSTSVLV